MVNDNTWPGLSRNNCRSSKVLSFVRLLSLSPHKLGPELTYSSSAVFFPNNSASSLRRLRIQRAQDYGASAADTWGDHVTHLIVDKGLTFHDVMKHLHLETFPPQVALVDESYPSECVKFRSVLNTAQVRFRVTSTPVPAGEKGSSSVEDPPESGSLPLKPSRRELQRETQLQLSHTEVDARVVGGQVTERQAIEQQPAELYTEDPVIECVEDTFAVSEPVRERDVLDCIIEEAKAVKDLPLDSDDEHPSTAETSDSEESDSAASCRKKRKMSARSSDGARSAWQQSFVCMQKHDTKANAENANNRTIAVLQQMLDYYDRSGDQWRTLAYRKAISALRKHPKKIATRSQALSLPGIGTRLADKIEEIVFTNRLRRLENASSTPEDRILQEFLGVYGAGITQASRWLAQGYRSLEDLRTKAPLTPNQRVGVEHYHDFAQRIPRNEVEVHGEIVRAAVRKADPAMQVIIGGSYRRGASSSGDVDLIITKPSATIEQIQTLMVETVVPGLFQQGFLQTSLAATSRGDGSKWHGASKLPDGRLWRRIDLLFVPGSEIGAALIYFTGNDIFNRSMRLLASKKGMRLNQRGLYADVLRGPQRVKLTTGRLVEGRDERRIFEILGVPWRPPEHRIC
ncbi:DNA-directed DNA polymerase IV [Aspergillus homomorphus CBS 101889]|uniref:DNA polymerase n=1 Tax=Aspergillus homomorphus (strain CBS 101889) TaxID=1450537 RepID=A0A395HYW5_ASPHC|nr:Nucleotidyltransferase [Aspergillus homomorphus CBS 101889]RAL11444.1 Nucleotidyltransferase [Aspergillus homomorphus CBS 101889]